MAKKYKILETSWINNRLVQPGDVVEYDGQPGQALEEIKEPKKVKTEPVAPADSGDDAPL